MNNSDANGIDIRVDKYRFSLPDRPNLPKSPRYDIMMYETTFSATQSSGSYLRPKLKTLLSRRAKLAKFRCN